MITTHVLDLATGKPGRAIAIELERAEHGFWHCLRGDGCARRVVRVVFGGARWYPGHTPRRSGERASRAPYRCAPDASTSAKGSGVRGGLAQKVRGRVGEKLGGEPVEDFRI